MDLSFLSRQNSFLENFEGFSKSIFDKKILIVGAGGIGSPISELLVRGGFKNLSIIDFDVIDQSNIQRQLYLPKDIGKFKVNVLKDRLIQINPDLNISIFIDKFDFNFFNEENINFDFIIDATDNFNARFEIDSFCIKKNIPWIYCASIGAEVSCSIFNGKESNFKKIFPENPIEQSCSNGVLSASTFIAASIANVEILKFFILKGKYEFNLIKFNIWNNKFFYIKK